MQLACSGAEVRAVEGKQRVHEPHETTGESRLLCTQGRRRSDAPSRSARNWSRTGRFHSAPSHQPRPQASATIQVDGPRRSASAIGFC